MSGNSNVFSNTCSTEETNFFEESQTWNLEFTLISLIAIKPNNRSNILGEI